MTECGEFEYACRDFAPWPFTSKFDANSPLAVPVEGYPYDFFGCNYFSLLHIRHKLATKIPQAKRNLFVRSN